MNEEVIRKLLETSRQYLGLEGKKRSKGPCMGR